MAGVFAPPKKYRLGSGGGKGAPSKAGGTMLGIALASTLAKPPMASPSNRVSGQAKHAFGGANHGAVSRRAIATMDRTARRVPEVVVRATGRQHGGGHVLANFTYISRLGHGDDQQVALYTSDGDVLREGRDMQILAQDWQEWEMGSDARRKGATSISMILSMPAGTDPHGLRDAALDFAREEFANRSWVAALHQDRDHPHVHLTIARRDHDGRRFHPTRDDFYRYRQRFAEKLRKRGIEANATAARARGVDPKHEPIAARKVREKGQVPRLDVGRQERVARLREAGIADPVDAVLRQRQGAVRHAYERSITELAGSPDPRDREVAVSLRRFTTSLPAPEANSVRAPREQYIDRGPALKEGGVSVIDRPSIDTADPAAAALARAAQVRDALRVKAEERERARVDRLAQAQQHDSPKPSLEGTDTLRKMIDLSRDHSADRAKDKRIDDNARRVDEQERERQARERDRSRDRDGPER